MMREFCHCVIVVCIVAMIGLRLVFVASLCSQLRGGRVGGAPMGRRRDGGGFCTSKVEKGGGAGRLSAGGRGKLGEGGKLKQRGSWHGP